MEHLEEGDGQRCPDAWKLKRFQASLLLMTEDKKIKLIYKSESEAVPDDLYFSYHFSHNNNNNNNNNKSNILITDTVYSTLKEDEEAGF